MPVQELLEESAKVSVVKEFTTVHCDQYSHISDSEIQEDNESTKVFNTVPSFNFEDLLQDSLKNCYREDDYLFNGCSSISTGT